MAMARFRFGVLAAVGIAVAVAGFDVADAQRRETPYYASISADQARMRTGPGKNYPASWLYVRADLPIRVVDIYRDWRKIEDPGGTQGWMQVGLLADRRTAIVTGGVAPLRSAPRPTASVAWRAEQGVVGRISRCARGWCYLDVKGRGGFVEQSRLWGIDPGEEL